MDLVCTPATSSTTTATSGVDDKDTEWRTTRQFVELGIKQRGEKSCRYCERTYKGGPDMIRAHPLSKSSHVALDQPVNQKPTTTKSTPRVQGSLLEVCVILRRRIHDAKHKEANQIKAVKNTADISSVFNMSPTVEQVTEQWMRALL